MHTSHSSAWWRPRAFTNFSSFNQIFVQLVFFFQRSNKSRTLASGFVCSPLRVPHCFMNDFACWALEKEKKKKRRCCFGLNDLQSRWSRFHLPRFCAIPTNLTPHACSRVEGFEMRIQTRFLSDLFRSSSYNFDNVLKVRMCSLPAEAEGPSKYLMFLWNTIMSKSTLVPLRFLFLASNY